MLGDTGPRWLLLSPPQSYVLCRVHLLAAPPTPHPNPGGRQKQAGLQNLPGF